MYEQKGSRIKQQLKSIQSLITFISLENHKLLFLESSALDSTNVEAAFNNVLMGESLILDLITFTDLNWSQLSTEYIFENLYHIV